MNLNIYSPLFPFFAVHLIKCAVLVSPIMIPDQNFADELLPFLQDLSTPVRSVPQRALQDQIIDVDMCFKFCLAVLIFRVFNGKPFRFVRACLRSRGLVA